MPVTDVTYSLAMVIEVEATFFKLSLISGLFLYLFVWADQSGEYLLIMIQYLQFI